MKIRYLGFFIFILSSFQTIGQTWHKLDSLQFKERITAFTVDYTGNLYLGFETGSLKKFNQDLKEIQNFRTPDFVNIDLIEAWNPLKAFLFSKPQQEYLFLERFSSSPILYQVRDLTREFTEFVIPGVDNSLWILESPVLQLKKFDATQNQMVLNVPIGRQFGIDRIDFFKAYKNLLIGSNAEDGLYFFDQFGNLTSKLNLPGISKFMIQQDKVVALANSQVIIFDIRTQKKEVLEGPPGYNGVILIGKRFYFITNDQIDIYSIL